MKYIFLTKKDSVIKVEGNRLILKDSRTIQMHKIGGILSFYKTPILECVKDIPIAFIESDYVTLKNVIKYIQDKKVNHSFIMNIEKISVSIYRKLVDSTSYTNYQMFNAWLFFEKRLTETYFAFLALLYLKKLNFSVNPYSEVSICGFKYPLWKAVVLPPTCFGVFNELHNTFNIGTERLKDKKSCVHAVLSNIMGNPKFKNILDKSLNMAVNCGICTSNHTETHGSFSSNSSKF